MHSPKRVGLVLHPRRDSSEAVQAILDWTGRRDATVVGLPGEVDRIGCDIEEVEPDELAGLDLLISLGGDGTMLRALRLSQPTGVPVLGVNLGRLGFLAEIDVPDLPAALAEIDAGNSTVETRVAVQVDFDDSTAFAFNDVAVVRYPGQPVAAVEVTVEGQSFVRYAADAIVVATPTGSTAYSFSAGGPIVSPRAEGLLVIPVAPHSVFNRAIFLSAGEPVGLELLTTSGRGGRAAGRHGGAGPVGAGVPLRPGRPGGPARHDDVLPAGPAQAAAGRPGRAGRGGRDPHRLISGRTG
jgi:NAD+ kinase